MPHESGWSDAWRSQLQRTLLDHLANGTTDSAEATSSVDARSFSDPEIAAVERERLFGRVPLIAAHGSELSEPGDFTTTTLLRSGSVILVRQPDRSVKAFLNVCRHRGAPVVDESRGHRRVFACPYHGWSYHPDGLLKAISDEGKFGAIDKGQVSLVELPAEERHGFVWVTDRVGADIDVASWLGPMDDVLEPYKLDGYVCVKLTTVPVRANWKILVDAFVDGYHLKFVHKKTAGPYFHNNTYSYSQHGRHAVFTSARRTIDELADGVEDLLEHRVTSGHLLMPNNTLLRQPTHFELLSFHPSAEGPAHSLMTFRLLVPVEDAIPERQARWDRNWDILMRVTKEEDLPLNERLQRSAEVPDAPPLLFGRNEIANQRFHENLQQCLRS